MGCKYCKRIISNIGSLVAHEMCCQNNPNKIKHKTGPNVGNKKGYVPWNSGLRKETDKRMQKCSDFLRNGYATGKYKKSSGIAPTKDLEDLRRKRISQSMKKNPNCGGYRKNSGRGKYGWYKGIWCQSSWELAWVIWALENKIDFQRNWKKFEYKFKGKIKYYIPDFILNNNDYVEVKGYWTKQFQMKIQQFPFNLEVFSKKEMKPILNYVIHKYGKNYINLYEKKIALMASNWT